MKFGRVILLVFFWILAMLFITWRVWTHLFENLRDTPW